MKFRPELDVLVKRHDQEKSDQQEVIDVRSIFAVYFTSVFCIKVFAPLFERRLAKSGEKG